MKLPLPAVVVTASRRVRPLKIKPCISTFVLNVIHSIPASRSCLILPVALISSVVNTLHVHNSVPFPASNTSKRPLRAFFCLVPLIFYTGSNHAVTPCRTTDSGRTVSITNVLDGDTVVMSTSEHVRLVGIDTPEMNYDAGRPEPGAVEAGEYLQGLLRDETQLTLVQDVESQDRYRRTLGHLFLADGTNVQATWSIIYADSSSSRFESSVPG